MSQTDDIPLLAKLCTAGYAVFIIYTFYKMFSLPPLYVNGERVHPSERIKISNNLLTIAKLPLPIECVHDIKMNLKTFPEISSDIVSTVATDDQKYVYLMRLRSILANYATWLMKSPGQKFQQLTAEEFLKYKQAMRCEFIPDAYISRIVCENIIANRPADFVPQFYHADMSELDVTFADLDMLLPSYLPYAIDRCVLWKERGNEQIRELKKLAETYQ